VNVSAEPDKNNLFPVFLKLEQLRVLIVGGGPVALEKINAINKSSPGTQVKIVAPEFVPEIQTLAASNARMKQVKRNFRWWDLFNVDVVILATGNRNTSLRIRKLARWKGLLVNVADTPDLCDFYLGSIVTKGSLKIGISTNGKSPTLAKRIRESMEEAFPDDTEKLLDNLSEIRGRLKGDFAEKVKKLNEITGEWLKK
jgi:precorrin-2 dehydrogenase / sirohydrochlorin ferrochelatase